MTGWEEHCRDEAHECGERVAMRREAEAEGRAEARNMAHEAMLEENDRRTARGFCLATFCNVWLRPRPYSRCLPCPQLHTAGECQDPNNIPF